MVRIKNVLVKLTLPQGQSSYKGNPYRYMASENGLFDTDDIQTNSHPNDNLDGENIQTPEQQHNSECIENGNPHIDKPILNKRPDINDIIFNSKNNSGRQRNSQNINNRNYYKNKSSESYKRESGFEDNRNFGKNRKNNNAYNQKNPPCWNSRSLEEIIFLGDTITTVIPDSNNNNNNNNQPDYRSAQGIGSKNVTDVTEVIVIPTTKNKETLNMDDGDNKKSPLGVNTKMGDKIQNMEQQGQEQIRTYLVFENEDKRQVWFSIKDLTEFAMGIQNGKNKYISTAFKKEHTERKVLEKTADVVLAYKNDCFVESMNIKHFMFTIQLLGIEDYLARRTQTSK